MSKVAVIGGCGRLGLRFSLIAASKGHDTTSIDIDDERITEINQGILPFVEPGAEKYLDQVLKTKKLTATFENEHISDADIVVITIGTPVDSNLNPSLEPVAGIIFDIAELLKENQLIVFRNTLSPGITGRIKNLIEEKTNFKVGKNIFIAFTPELINENQNIQDLTKAAQPIGAFDQKSFNLAKDFFETITSGTLKWVSPEEALLAKLMTNMFEYVKSACANEFYLIAESFGVNIHNILDASGRHDIPNPDLNAAGAGMHKEGWFLVDRIPFNDLITNSFKINESMQALIVNRLEKYNVNKVAVLGMTSKINSDDARASLSYKLRKALYYRDYIVACYDPYLPEYSDSSVLQDSDAVILMTPHDEFKNFEKLKRQINNPNCIFIDISGFWKETKENAENGFLQLQKERKFKKN